MTIYYALQQYLPAEDSIEVAAENGYSYWYLDASLYSELPELWCKNRISKIQEKIELFGIKPIIHSNFRLPLASETHSIRMAAIKVVYQEIMLAANFNCPVVIHGGAVIEPREIKYSLNAALKRLAQSLNEIYLMSTNLGVPVMFENLANHHTHPFYYIGTSEEQFDILRHEVNQLRVFFDAGHANVNNCEPLNFLERVLPIMDGLSLSDNDGMRDTHSVLGSGTLNVPSILRLIVEKDWGGIIGLEIRRSDIAVDLKRIQSEINYYKSMLSR